MHSEYSSPTRTFPVTPSIRALTSRPPLYPPGAHQRPPQILDQRRLVGLAAFPPRDRLDMPGAEQRAPLDQDPAELAGAVGVDRQDEGGGAGLMVDRDVRLAHFGEGIAALAQLDPQGR